MKPDRFSRLRELVLKVVDLPEDERRILLDEACKDDPELKAEIELMLSHDPDQREILKTAGVISEPPRDLPQVDMADSLIGQTISHYEILEKIGEGGMGRVYRGRDMKLRREVALKTLSDRFKHDPERVARLQREARALASLQHPNIASIFGFEEADERHFLVMELVEGQNLAERLRGGALPTDESLEISLQIAEGLECAHQRGIVHRDLKPSNVKVTPEGRVKILDFGLARAYHAETSADTDIASSSAISAPMTQPGVVLGTVAYMSPEQARGKPVDWRADIWAFGCVLYEMLTAKRAFSGETPSDRLAMILERQPDWESLPKSLPPAIRQLLRRCLTKAVSDRLQAIGDARITIKECIRKPSRSGDTAKTSPLLPKTHYSVGLAILMSAVLLALLFYSTRDGVFRQREPPRDVAAGTHWINSVAVLPFTDLSPTKDQEHFCDGMTGDIIGRLAKIDRFKVISRTSVVQYKNTSKSITDIGSELGVANVLEGTIQKEGDSIRVAVQLIDARTNFTLFSESYDRALPGVFSVQDDISRAIADALKLRLTDNALASYRAGQPQNMALYEDFLRGMYFINSRYVITYQESDFRAALEMFERAQEINPEYALTYAGLTWAYWHRYLMSDDMEDFQQVLENAELAFEMNPDLAESNLAKGFVHQTREEHDMTFEYYRIAFSKSPNDMEVCAGIGYWYLMLGLFETAITYSLKATELSPFYIFARLHVANCYVGMGDLEEAERQFKRAFDLNPRNVFGLYYYTSFLTTIGKLEEAERHLQMLGEIDPEFSGLRRCRARLHAARGERNEALALSESPIIYSLLDMKEEAISAMNDRIQEGYQYKYGYLIHNPVYENLRGHPSFEEIVARARNRHEELSSRYGEL